MTRSNELRHSVATGDWVVLSPTRRDRPKQTQKSQSFTLKTSQASVHDPKCPFCPGNEHLTPDAVLKYESDKKCRVGWHLRVVPNKFPVVSVPSDMLLKIEPRDTLLKANHGIDALGYHEVIVETPFHNLCTAIQSKHGVKRLVQAWRERGQFYVQNFEGLRSIMFFKNQGKVAGASLVHPHAQIVALPIVPHNLDILCQNALSYYVRKGESVWTHTVKEELESQERIIDMNSDFVSFVPYAATSPFFIRIVPLTNQPFFVEMNGKQLDSFSEILWKTLRRLHILLNEPDYNINIFSAPLQRGSYAAFQPSSFFRWHASIIPRLGEGAVAGFEFGSGIFCNSSFPEDNAHELRQITEQMIHENITSKKEA